MDCDIGVCVYECASACGCLYGYMIELGRELISHVFKWKFYGSLLYIMYIVMGYPIL